MKLIIEYQNSRKKIMLDSVDDLKTTIEEKFHVNLNHIIIQMFDKDDDTFLDVDDLSDINDGDKLKLVTKFCEAEASFSIAQDSTQHDSMCASDTTLKPIENHVIKLKQGQSSKEPEEEYVDTRPPWPLIFKIPKENIGKSLRERLEAKEHLDRNYKTQIFKVLYEEASKYYDGNNPDRSQYVVMIKTLLEDYPYLMGKASFTDAMRYWKVKLGDHFRNARKQSERDKPSVKANRLKILNKRNNGRRVQSQPYTNKYKNSWGIKNFLPERCEGEDDETITQHMKILDNQNKIVPNLRNKTTINASMDKTFPERRKFILEDGIKSIQEIKNEYPLLFCYDQIFAEYSRLNGVNLMEKFTNGIKVFSDKLIRLGTFKNEFPLLRSLRERMKTAKLQSVKEYYDICCSITVVPQHLREKVADFFLTKESEEISSYPRILLEAEPFEDDAVFKVLAEGVTICECKDLLSAYAAMFASFYIFNLSYPDKLKKTLSFFQKPILNITDKEKKDDRVTRFVTSLQM